MGLKLSSELRNQKREEGWNQKDAKRVKIYPDNSFDDNSKSYFFESLFQHNIVLQKFREFCFSVDATRVLEFYLSTKDIESVVEALLDPSDRVIVFNRILDYQPYPSQTILLAPLNHFAVVDDFKVLVTAMNQLRLAQHEALFHLRFFWRLFLNSSYVDDEISKFVDASMSTIMHQELTDSINSFVKNRSMSNSTLKSSFSSQVV